MNQFIKILSVFIIVMMLTNGCSDPVPKSVHVSDIALGWAKNSVNTTILRKNSLVTFNDTQFTAFYDSTGHVVLAKRQLGTDQWLVKQTRYTGKITDAHNSISIMVDGDGYLHMAWNHHNDSLRYCKSIAPGLLELTEKLSMIGRDEVKVTYPEFYRLPSGDLIFLYRVGKSGDGKLVMNRYNLVKREWVRLQDNLIDGEGERNAYWQFAVDLQGTFHLSWVWRETGDVATNHDMCYAKSTDGGVTWIKTTGELCQIPINKNNAEYAVRISQNSELINQTSMCADSKGRPYIATFYRQDKSSIPQYHLIYHDGKAWQTRQVSDRETPFSLSGGGTKRIPMSRPVIIVDDLNDRDAAYMLFRDIESENRVMVAVCKDLTTDKWENKPLSTKSVGAWEPSYDIELWKMNKILHIFVQNSGQGDGEKLETLPSQMVSVIEWKPE